MKKLTLNNVNFAKAEVLSRTQLKKVMGGSGSDVDPCYGATNGCPIDWSPKVCHINNFCAMGTLICVPDDIGCAYYNN